MKWEVESSWFASSGAANRSKSLSKLQFLRIQPQEASLPTIYGLFHTLQYQALPCSINCCNFPMSRPGFRGIQKGGSDVRSHRSNEKPLARLWCPRTGRVYEKLWEFTQYVPFQKKLGQLGNCLQVLSGTWEPTMKIAIQHILDYRLSVVTWGEGGRVNSI